MNRTDAWSISMYGLFVKTPQELHNGRPYFGTVDEALTWHRENPAWSAREKWPESFQTCAAAG